LPKVCPKLYGGTERVVAWLTNELIELGHDVTLFASGDSVTRGTLVPVWPRALRLGRPRAAPAAALAALLEAVARQAANFDVIHCHVDWTHLPLLARLGVPFLTTLHNRLDTPGLAFVIGSFLGAPFVSISNDQRTPCPEAHWLATVYHGLPPDSLRPRFEPGGYLAFLGRLTPEKGPETAIEIARAANMPLHIAAKVPRGERRYFKKRLEPLIDGEKIQLTGEVDDRGKQDFLAHTAALVAEVIENGVTGFIVDSSAEAVEAVKQLGTLDRRRVRAEFEQRFTARRMAEDYVRQYDRLTATAGERCGRR
jgi:glycosyltransferase involved in cell wall biosynthesis